MEDVRCVHHHRIDPCNSECLIGGGRRVRYAKLRGHGLRTVKARPAHDHHARTRESLQGLDVRGCHEPVSENCEADRLHFISPVATTPRLSNHAPHCFSPGRIPQSHGK